MGSSDVSNDEANNNPMLIASEASLFDTSESAKQAAEIVAKLTSDEDQAVGEISSKVYTGYLRALGGWKVLLFLACVQVFKIFPRG